MHTWWVTQTVDSLLLFLWPSWTRRPVQPSMLWIFVICWVLIAAQLEKRWMMKMMSFFLCLKMVCLTLRVVALPAVSTLLMMQWVWPIGETSRKCSHLMYYVFDTDSVKTHRFFYKLLYKCNGSVLLNILIKLY